MPPRKAPKTASAAAAAAAPVEGRDHISNLPDGALQHILSFLRAQDAVQTCVLAKRWRHMWKSTTGLRFVGGRMEEPDTMNKTNKEFVDHVLRLRISGDTPLHACEFGSFQIGEDAMSRIILWIRIALQCKVRVLKLNCGLDTIGPLDDHPLFMSQYLKKLELDSLDEPVPSRLLDFSYCPFLEDLELVKCYLEGALLISSQSLKRLTIEACSFAHDDGYRMLICAPNLVSLWLDVGNGRAPSLQRMPSLITAFVKIRNNYDFDNDESNYDDYSNRSILFQGLSEVRNLVLLSYRTKMFVFRRDLKFCSSFNNLKSLLLDEYWCEPADFSALACLLKLCPVLEKLTLQLYSEGPEHNVEMKLSCKPSVMSAAISQHLKIIEVKCEVYDNIVRNVLTFLSKLDIWFQFSG